MKNILTGLVVCVVLAVTCNFARGADPQEAIKSCVAGFAAAWNQHDTKAMAAFWAEDGDLINPFGRVAKGREQVEQLFKDEHAGPMKGTTHEMTVSSVRMVGDNAALVDVDSTITGMHDPEGKEMPVFKPHVFLVMTQKEGQWMITAARPYSFMPPPGPAKMEGMKMDGMK